MSIKITCRTPSTGKPINVLLADVPNTYTTIAEPPYYSVPDTSQKFPVRDSEYPDNSRALREGEIFFVTPLSARNKTTSDCDLEVRIVTENSVTIEFSKVTIPAGDTALIPLQGRSLFKRNIDISTEGNDGDILQVRSSVASAFDVWASGEEKPSNEHSGVV